MRGGCTSLNFHIENSVLIWPNYGSSAISTVVPHRPCVSYLNLKYFLSPVSPLEMSAAPSYNYFLRSVSFLNTKDIYFFPRLLRGSYKVECADMPFFNCPSLACSAALSGHSRDHA